MMEHQSASPPLVGVVIADGEEGLFAGEQDLRMVSDCCEIGSLRDTELQLAKFGDQLPQSSILYRKKAPQTPFSQSSRIHSAGGKSMQKSQGRLSDDRLENEQGFNGIRENQTLQQQQKNATSLGGHTSMSSSSLASDVPLTTSTTKQVDHKAAAANVPKLLVELSAYPGFNPASPTPLPGGIRAIDHLRLVTNAQLDLKIKLAFKKEWEKVFHSRPVRHIFQDYYWWFFLHIFQPREDVQAMIFDRVSDNYVAVLQSLIPPTCRDKILQRLPDSIAQAVYSTFSHAFPTSWKQFHAIFKTELLIVITTWMTGTKPLPYNWMTWPYQGLDSPLMRKSIFEQEKAANEERRKADPTAEVIQTLKDIKVDGHRSPLSRTNSQALPPLSARSRATSQVITLPRENSLHASSTNESRTSQLAQSKAHNRCQSGASICQTGAVAATPCMSLAINVDPTSTIPSISGKEESRQPQAFDSQAQDSLSPMISQSVVCVDEKGNTVTEENTTTAIQGKIPAKCETKHNLRARRRKVKRISSAVEYTPSIAPGTIYEKCLFDVSGHSPLVQHYMQLNGLIQDVGMSYALERTQVQQIPKEGAVPLSDRLHQVTRRLHSIREKQTRLKEISQMEAIRTDKLLRHTRQDMTRRVESLLLQKEEVKMLSDRISLETKQDPASVALSAIVLGGQNTAAKAVAEALAAQN